MPMNPLQAVLLWQHHQNTTPFMPHTSPLAVPPMRAAKPQDEKDEPPFDTLEETQEEEEKEEDGEEEDQEDEEADLEEEKGNG